MRFSNLSWRETSGMNLKKQPSVLPKKNSNFVGKKSENIMDKKNKTVYFGQFFFAVPVHNPFLEIINIKNYQKF